MHIFVKDLKGESHLINCATFIELESKIEKKMNIKDCRITCGGRPVNRLYDWMTVSIVGTICGGKLTEDDKVLANKRLEIKICRKCNARLNIRATHCRKRACGFSNKLRLKKKLRESGKK